MIACATALWAQGPASSRPPGLETDWEIAPVLQEISDHAGRLLSFLETMDVRSWVERGASETYLEQWQSSRDQAKAIVDGAKALARNPQKLSASLELLFRMQGVDTMLDSLVAGIRKYQTNAIAQDLIRLEAENGISRDRFQGYIVNLAAEREKDLQVMDREAQRCRAVLTQAPPKSSGRKK